MQTSTLGNVCDLIQREVVAGLRRMPGMNPRRLTVEVGLEVLSAGDGTPDSLRVVSLAPEAAAGGGKIGAKMSLELEFPGIGALREHPKSTHSSSLPKLGETGESVTGGDAATLRRRLEMILGGRPGFTTGAKAEILSDLLREFGRPAILDAIAREWVVEFDTSLERSPSLSPGDADTP